MHPTRRERYRQQTIDEIKAIAMKQLVESGEAAVSLNGIAKEMAMSPGALYRYFDNRDDLLADLVVDAYNDLAEHLQAAATASDPTERLRAVAQGYREWALHSPNTYRLIFESVSGSGLTLAADRVVPAARRSMNVFLHAIAAAATITDLPVDDTLRDELTRWGNRAEHPELPVAVLYLGLTTWTRLHGLLSLEIGNHLAATGISADLLYGTEIDTLMRTIAPEPVLQAPLDSGAS
ncbi:MAG TPA: TetR/AcrR family transcriptional regulator [Jatrophihabitans sp.]|nr:TetR/AcrR family transcriptional regulator [Jatrophihabitans sp.]